MHTQGYHTKSAYLITQAPLPNTVGDIWRMVFDYKSTCIVMLNQLDNDPVRILPRSYPSSAQYITRLMTSKILGYNPPVCPVLLLQSVPISYCVIDCSADCGQILAQEGQHVLRTAHRPVQIGGPSNERPRRASVCHQLSARKGRRASHSLQFTTVEVPYQV